MTIKEGDTLPGATLMRMTDHGPEKVETGAFFAGKRTVLFSVPGAFTPTCSARHLPGFVDKAAEFKAKGIDQIVGTAVNDVFVLSAWGKAGEIGEKIVLLADGNGEFVRALGLELDGSGFGMGARGQRFAMVVEDGKVEKLFIEAPGEFKVSAAEHVLAQL